MRVEERIRSINRFAPIQRCQQSDVSVDRLVVGEYTTRLPSTCLSPTVSCPRVDALHTHRDINFRRLLPSPVVSCRLLPSTTRLSLLPNHHPKVKKVLADGMKPILCIGETKEEYEAGLCQAVCAVQIAKDLAVSRGTEWAYQVGVPSRG